jgi:AcrR family transcriptional regulator
MPASLPVRRAPPRPRRREPAEKQARILAAAQRLFVARGFVATTTADIARAAEVSEGIVFHHFGSKEGLLLAVASDYGRGLTEAMFAEGGEPHGPPEAEAMLRAAFAYVRENGELSRLLMLLPAAADPGSARHATRERIVEALTLAFERWQRLGLIRPLDAGIVAELMHALVERALVECFVRGDGSREADYLRETVRCVVGATLREASG